MTLKWRKSALKWRQNDVEMARLPPSPMKQLKASNPPDSANLSAQNRLGGVLGCL